MSNELYELIHKENSCHDEHCIACREMEHAIRQWAVRVTEQWYQERDDADLASKIDLIKRFEG